MNILSDPARDTRATGQPPGGYEWWYFDALSDDGRYSFVAIFYEGNPFSTRYIKALEEKTGPASPASSSTSTSSGPMPSEYPAVSISVYDQGEPVYYSFTEYDATDCIFSEERPLVEIGPHRMKGSRTGGQLLYSLSLNEELPSGDRLRAELTFDSPAVTDLFEDTEDHSPAGHHWNLVQPLADVSGTIEIGAAGKGAEDRTVAFRGEGYHDHNRGDEPMREEFTDWYWGRCHFDYATLVYYVMNGKGKDGPSQHQHQAWLIDPSGSKITARGNQIDVSDKSLSLFGLYSGRKLSMRGHDGTEMQVQQSRLLDNGPFYQRFLSDVFLSVPGSRVLESARGITEYICPGRIYGRVFWPLVNMRIRQAHAKPHWVQRSGRLYRWTW
ncbi:hydroxyneurosporene synthase [Fodinibius roseus]|uniref:Hydroxyneurosporene synthase n=1 Tax=Fodinibius roseus TaxID=1194090 RepID=A0A1M5DJJ5_9BACT|nr:hypothetical protein [Fodinibius roseus]SHF67130.1 hydroxyneurosporene synthase [Fodinibius roseus]